MRDGEGCVKLSIGIVGCIGKVIEWVGLAEGPVGENRGKGVAHRVHILL